MSVLSSNRVAGIVGAVIVVVASVAVWSTAGTFSGTVDEPAHLAAGMEWLSTGKYTYDLQHPPLGRVAAAIGPYLHGTRTAFMPGIYREGAQLLGAGQHYVDTLARARHGEIVFFLLLAVVTCAWAKRLAGEYGAVAATLLVATNPNILAHAGLATTDIACAATTMLALFAATLFLEQPTWRRAVLFGVCTGLALSSRLSAIAFVGGPFVAAYVLRGWSVRRWSLDVTREGARSVRDIAIGFAAAALVILAAYRFSPRPFIDGVDTFLLHGSSGHPTFLLGRASNHGWWYYFPVALLVKTPLPLLILGVVGSIGVAREVWARRDWRTAMPLASAVAILLIGMVVRVDLGVRLVLPFYPLLAIVAAQGTMQLWNSGLQRQPARSIIIGLCTANVYVAFAAYPDYLSYFNRFAGRHPERVLVDSNLDWGQDLYRLRDTLAAHGIRDSVRVAYFGTADLGAAGIRNARLLGVHEHATGWVAASETFLAGEWVGPAYTWLLGYPPAARIGPSMRLWYIPPDPPPATRDSSRR